MARLAGSLGSWQHAQGLDVLAEHVEARHGQQRVEQLVVRRGALVDRRRQEPRKPVVQGVWHEAVG